MMLELALRSTAVLAAAWLLIRVMPRATAATRHLIWHMALAATVLAALASIANVPKVRVVPRMPAALAPMVPDALSAQATQVARALDVLSTPLPGSPSESPASRILAGDTRPVSATVGTLSTLGTLAVSLWFLAGWVAASRMTRRATAAPDAWQMELNALCQRLRIEHEVRLGILDRHGSPLATGLLRATILLPRTAMSWSDDRRRAVLLHELAHIRRRDCRAQLIAQIACAIYWFNPVVWMAATKLRREREFACDDHVLHLGARASSYAAHLLDIARELRPSMRPSAALAMARPSDLEGRLLSVLAAKRARAPRRATRWLVASAVSTTSIIAVTITAAPQTPAGREVTAPSTRPYVVAHDIMTAAEPSPLPRDEAEATLRAAPDAQERERATLALAFSSGRDVIPALLQALADTDAQVREKAAIGLALRRDTRVVEPLIAALEDVDSQVREKAAIALGTSGDPRAQDALRRALNDPDAQVREKAAAGLILTGLTR
jgi:beta-lactamase regulating signal transducer with metallopeptidase domain